MKPSNLTFRPDGTFRVLMMSDLQESACNDPRSLRSVEALLLRHRRATGSRLFVHREENPEAVEPTWYEPWISYDARKHNAQRPRPLGGIYFKGT